MKAELRLSRRRRGAKSNLDWIRAQRVNAWRRRLDVDSCLSKGRIAAKIVKAVHTPTATRGSASSGRSALPQERAQRLPRGHRDCPRWWTGKVATLLTGAAAPATERGRPPSHQRVQQLELILRQSRQSAPLWQPRDPWTAASTAGGDHGSHRSSALRRRLFIGAAAQGRSGDGAGNAGAAGTDSCMPGGGGPSDWSRLHGRHRRRRRR